MIRDACSLHHFGCCVELIVNVMACDVRDYLATLAIVLGSSLSVAFASHSDVNYT